jgi:regulator of replication initiation timing
VEQLNQAIAQKNTEDEIWKLSNELDYFKTQTYNLFNENKKLREQAGLLRASLREMQVQIENNDLLMQKLKKKFMRENFIKDKLAALVREKVRAGKAQEITLEQIDDVLKLQRAAGRPRMKTEPTNDPSSSSKFFQSKVNIQMNNSVLQNPARFAFNEEPDRITEKFSIPSSFNEEAEPGIPDLPPVRFVRVESFFTEGEKPVSSFKRKLVEKGIQTEEVRTEDETHRGNAIKPFSNTSYIDLPRAQPGKKLDLYKSGFFVRSYNQNAERIAAKDQKPVQGSGKKQPSHNRYMSNALNKSKMGGSKV